MALLAGRDDVLAREVRAGVGDLLDVVGAVAVVALGRLGVAELADLAVVGVEVGLGDLAVAPAALLHDVELEAVGVGPPDGVRAVAVVADRQLLVGLPQHLVVDASLELLLDAVVAPAAGLRHVRAVHARGRVRPRQDAVGGMAARAGGGHGEAALEQPLAVDALRVRLDDPVLRPLVPHRRLLALAVAARAQPGDVGGEGRRRALEPPQSPVRPVALRARWGVRVAVEEQLAVLAAGVLLGDLRVAGAAIHLRGDRLAGPPVRDVHPRVALRAGHLDVPGLQQARARPRTWNAHRPP